MNLKEFRSNALAFYRSGTALELVGPPGIGKTEVKKQIVRDLARYYNEPVGLCTQILSTVNAMDIRGYLTPPSHVIPDFLAVLRAFDAEYGDALGKLGPIVKALGNLPIERSNEATWSRPGIFPSMYNVSIALPDGTFLKRGTPEAIAHIEKYGIPNRGILDLDELAQTGQDEQKASSQLMLEKDVGDFSLPEGWVVWAASNRMEDRSGVVKQLMMLQNRRKVLNILPDYEAWQEWAFTNATHPLGIAFAKANAGDVFREAVPKDPGPFCTPRSLVLCLQDLVAMTPRDYGSHKLIDNHIATEVVAGWLGEGITPKFMQHIRLGNELPDVDDVLRAPDKTPVPQRLDARFVMATSLSAHATTKEKMKPILIYIERLDMELQTIFVSAVVKRFPTAITVNEFSQWLARNQKLILAAKG